MKDFEEVLNQVKNLVAVEYNYASHNNMYYFHAKLNPRSVTMHCYLL